MSIIVEPLGGGSSKGIPPYYMFAFEVGGIPTTQMIGSDPANLTWIADHKQGKGGAPGRVYMSIANKSWFDRFEAHAHGAGL